MKKLLSVAACGLSKLVPGPRQSKYAPAFTLTACAVLGVIVMLAIPVAAAQPTKAEQLAVDFDTETLKARGIDPNLADYFRLAPKFTQGEHRSEEHTSELQSLMRISYAVFCLKKKKTKTQIKLHMS